jgi:hypothetical protein
MRSYNKIFCVFLLSGALLTSCGSKDDSSSPSPSNTRITDLATAKEREAAIKSQVSNEGFQEVSFNVFQDQLLKHSDELKNVYPGMAIESIQNIDSKITIQGELFDCSHQISIKSIFLSNDNDRIVSLETSKTDLNNPNGPEVCQGMVDTKRTTCVRRENWDNVLNFGIQSALDGNFITAPLFTHYLKESNNGENMAMVMNNKINYFDSTYSYTVKGDMQTVIYADNRKPAPLGGRGQAYLNADFSIDSDEGQIFGRMKMSSTISAIQLTDKDISRIDIKRYTVCDE